MQCFTSKDQLIKFLLPYFYEHGLHCSLNHLDISALDDLSFLFSPLHNTYFQGKYIEFHRFNGDISQWDTSQVTDMHSMFYRSEFNGNISNWDVSQVNNMTGMFQESRFNGDISAWNVSNVTQMGALFEDGLFNRDVSKWNTSKVREMFSMFKNTPFDGDLSNWDVSNVTTMASMFDGCPFHGDLSRWNVSNVRDMVFIFFNKHQFPCVDSWVLHPQVDAALAFGIDSPGVPLSSLSIAQGLREQQGAHYWAKWNFPQALWCSSTEEIGRTANALYHASRQVSKPLFLTHLPD